MRRIVSITHITLDGVVQSNGGPGKEDESNGFGYGGWSMKFQDEKAGEFFADLVGRDFDLLLGRNTYDLFASYWPFQDTGLFAKAFNDATKYVVSHSSEGLTWDRSEQVEDVRKLKESDGPELHIWGSANVIQGLLKTGLIDEMVLLTYPVILGPGNRLFDGESIATRFDLTQTSAAGSGVTMSKYERVGDFDIDS